MSQQNKEVKTSSPAEPPMKRKRGRPRKDETLVQVDNVFQMPGSNGVKKTQEGEVDVDGDSDDEMVGQPVSGFLEGAFDAGYFLTVKVGNTDILLRGVVFQPGLLVPVTAANDVAPHAKMYRRKEIPIPIPNLQAQSKNSVNLCEQDNKLPTQLENQALIVPDQVLPSELHSDISLEVEKQSTPVMVPLTDNLTQNDISLNLGRGYEKSQQTSDCRQENQSASVTQLESNRTVKQHEIVHDFGATILREGPKIDVVEASKDAISVPSSEPHVNMLSDNETINQVPKIQEQAANYVPNLNELVSREVKSPNLELHQAPVVTECNSMFSEAIGMQIDIPMERLASPKTNIVQDTNLELAVKILSGDDTSQFNERSVGEAANISDASLQSEVKTSKPEMNFQAETIPFELKIAGEGSPELPKVLGGPADVMDCDVKHPIPTPPTQSQIFPLVSNNPSCD